MLKIFLSSTYRDLAEYRSKILEQLDSAFKGVGMEEFIPDGDTSQKICIADLKKSDIVIFLISPYYGSSIKFCELKENCKAKCSMKTGEGRISYTHCEYKTTIAEGILHQTYLVKKGWDAPDIPEASQFKEEIGKEIGEMWKEIDTDDPNLVKLICNNLAKKIIEWHSQKKLIFEKFCDRIEDFDELIKSIDGKVEVYGVGGVGKTALIQVALLIQKLKGKKIVTIGTPKSYASGSGFEDFRTKCKDDQYEAESRNEITIYDIVNALVKAELLSNAEEILKMPKNEIIEFLSNFIKKEENLTLFIDDFHLANKDVVLLVKSVENIIFSSRKNTYIAKKEICITGIGKEDRDDLINLFSAEELPEKAKELIEQIAEGHPVSTELLVKNYQNIDFDNIKDFDLEDADDEQVMDFYKRVIEEIFYNNAQALVLLKDLAILNTDLPTNINRESVLKSYDIEGIRKVFKNLVDTGMVKKRQGSEGIYEFYFKHIQDYLEDEAEKSSHEKAILYYEKKKKILNDKYNINDDVEVLYHKVKSTPNEYLVAFFLSISNIIQPVHYGFKRLIDIGEEIKNSQNNKDRAGILNNIGLAMTQNNLGILYGKLRRFAEAETAYIEALDAYKELATMIPDAYLPTMAIIQNNLGAIYSDLGRFAEAETVYQEALEIRRALADKNPGEYLPDIADAQNNLGALYLKLRRFEEAETAFQEAFEIRRALADKNPGEYLPDIADAQNNLGALYLKLRRFEEAETAFQEAFEIRRALADKNPGEYLPNIAATQDNLGTLYADLGRFAEAETAYQEALDIRKELADKNPDAYMLDVTMTQNNLGILYADLGRFAEAETAYQEALDIRKELAAKNPDAYLPDVAVTQNSLGNLYSNLGRFAEAETAYTEALDIRKELADKNPDAYMPDVAMTQNNLGLLYINLGRFAEAETAYQEVLNIRKELAAKNPDAYLPDVAQTQTILGSLYINLERYEEAIECYNKALEIDPEYIDALCNKGAALAWLKRYDQATECYDKSLTLDKNYGIAWYNKACLESLRNNNEKSIEFLRKAIELDTHLKNDARTEEEFNNVRESKEFKELIGEIR